MLLWSLKPNGEIYYCSFVIIDKLPYYGCPSTAMHAILATIVDGGRAIVDIDIEAGRNKLFFHLI
jgi:hypothetical protein